MISLIPEMMNFRSLNDLSFKLHFLLSPIGKTGPVRSDFPDQQSQFIFPVGKGQNDLRSQTLIERDLSFRPPGLALKPGAQTSARRYEIRGNLPGILPAVLRTALRGHAGRQPQRRQCLPNRRTAGRLIPDGRLSRRRTRRFTQKQEQTRATEKHQQKNDGKKR